LSGVKGRSGGRNRRVGVDRLPCGRIRYSGLCACGLKTASPLHLRCQRCYLESKAKDVSVLVCECGSPKSKQSKRCQSCYAKDVTSKSARTCLQCGVLFQKSSTNNTAGMFHSRACAYAFVRRRSVERLAAKKQQAQQRKADLCVAQERARMDRMRLCVTCGIQCVPTSRGACSRVCAKGLPIKSSLPIRPCVDCGEAFQPWRISASQCKACNKRKHKRLARKRSGNKHCDRARLKGAPRDYGLGPVKVFERDGWHCRICGKSTPKRLQGKQLPDSPTVDHIVPFAMGGGHTWDNVQLACHACNMDKGATVRGQLRLGLFKADETSGGYRRPTFRTA